MTMQQADWKTGLKPIAAVILLPLIFFWRELAGMAVFAGFDFTHLILPFQQFARDSLASGHLPEWNPYLFAGFPQLAEGEGGLFYPGNLLLWLPGDQSVLLVWTVVLHLVLTGLLMYGLLRSRGISATASGWIAIFYQLLPGLLLRAETVGLFEAAVWLPGLYWSLEISIDSISNGLRSRWFMWTLMGSATVAMMLLAGSSQIAFYGMIGAIFWLGGKSFGGVRPWRLAGWSILTLVLIAGFSLALAAVQVIPTYEFSGLSYRVQESSIDYYRLGTWLNLPRLASLFTFPAIREPSELLDYISSLGYIGLLPFILLSIGLSVHKRWMNPILAPFMLIFFGLLLSFGLNFMINIDLITFPGFSLFRALGRMILPVAIGMMAIAARGLDSLFIFYKDEPRRAEIRSGFLYGFIVAAALLVWFLIYEGFPLTGFEVIGLVNLVIAALIVIVCIGGYIRTRRSQWLIVLLGIWLVMQLVSSANLKSAITMDRGSYRDTLQALTLDGAVTSPDPNRPARVLIATEDDVWEPLMARLLEHPFSPGHELPIPALGNELTLGGIGVINGYTPLVTDRWQEVVHEYAASGLDEVDIASDRLRVILALTCTDAVIAPGSFVGGDGFEPVDADLEGLFPDGWHALSTPDRVPYVSIPRKIEGWTESYWEWFKHFVVEEDYTSGEVVSIELNEYLQLPVGMVWDRMEEWEDEGESERVWSVWEMEEGGENEIESIERESGRILIDVQAGVPCWVVVRESWMPGWHVLMDGREIMPARADYLFIGVPVAEGEHRIEMKYETPGLKDGRMVSGGGWVVWGILAIAMVLIPPRHRSRHSTAT